MRELIEKLEGMDPTDEKRHAHFKVLTEYVAASAASPGKEIQGGTPALRFVMRAA